MAVALPMSTNHVLGGGSPGGVRVNACGRLVDISAENSRSVPLLRRELGLQLNVQNPAALQLMDAMGRNISTDGELHTATQDSTQPIQAKLTAAALHEIEQKKLEGRSKEHNLISLQWQIVIEQVAAFSYELSSVSGQLQSVKDECRRNVRAFEEAEAVRREDLMGAIRNEANERKAGHAHLLEKIDGLMTMMLAEQSAREVADFQLSKQIEQLGHDVHTEQNGRASDQAEMARTIAALRHDHEVAGQKNAEKWVRAEDTTQRMLQKVEEHSAGHLEKQNRLTLLEADTEKLRLSVGHLDNAVLKHHTDMHSNFQRHGEELERAVREGALSRGADAARGSKESDIAIQSLGQKIQRLRDETCRGQMDLAERSKAIELRCAALEKEYVSRQETEDTKARVFLDKVQAAVTTLDAFQMEHQASDAVLSTTVNKVNDLLERMQLAENSLDHRVVTEHWRAQLEGFSQITQKQDLKLLQLERELHARTTQEAYHRDSLKNQLQGSLRTCLERIAPQEAEEARNRSPLPQRGTESPMLAPPIANFAWPAKSKSVAMLAPAANIQWTATGVATAAPQVAPQMPGSACRSVSPQPVPVQGLSPVPSSRASRGNGSVLVPRAMPNVSLQVAQQN
mmetsp:Transcript_3667/g.9356  ORF Transcript_3667/g.9356 Transcript_3667/m.9356 type:complete len:626 (+) Transcript_3667:90-1967(+)